jgi:hypothetical protein
VKKSGNPKTSRLPLTVLRLLFITVFFLPLTDPAVQTLNSTREEEKEKKRKKDNFTPGRLSSQSQPATVLSCVPLGCPTGSNFTAYILYSTKPQLLPLTTHGTSRLRLPTYLPKNPEESLSTFSHHAPSQFALAHARLLALLHSRCVCPPVLCPRRHFILSLGVLDAFLTAAPLPPDFLRPIRTPNATGSPSCLIGPPTRPLACTHSCVSP